MTIYGVVRMNNPFKAHLPNIVFDVQSPAVTEAEISQWRIALKKAQARLSTLETFIYVFLMVLVGGVIWATYTADTMSQPLVFFMGGAVVIAAARYCRHKMCQNAVFVQESITEC